MPSIPYYCPQLRVEEPITLEGKGTHNVMESVQSNQSLLALCWSNGVAQKNLVSSR
ncbi:hypothetical protein MKX01_009416 [Papaver californicum]|nr:hypothetical protein MKX01_009416 [Papaver californicum]